MNVLLGFATCLMVLTFTQAQQRTNAFRRNQFCPDFSSRYEGDNLVIDLVPEACQMVVGSFDMSNLYSGFFARDSFGSRSVHIPTVTYRRVARNPNAVNQENPESVMCPPYSVRHTGTRAVVDTVPGACELVIGVRTFQVAASGGSGFIMGRPMGMRMATRPVILN